MLRSLSRGFRYFYRTRWSILIPGIHTQAVTDLAVAKSVVMANAGKGFLLMLFTFREPTFTPSF